MVLKKYGDTKCIGKSNRLVSSSNLLPNKVQKNITLHMCHLTDVLFVWYASFLEQHSLKGLCTWQPSWMAQCVSQTPEITTHVLWQKKFADVLLSNFFSPLVVQGIASTCSWWLWFCEVSDSSLDKLQGLHNYCTFSAYVNCSLKWLLGIILAILRIHVNKPPYICLYKVILLCYRFH